MARGLGGASLALFGGMFALEVAYAAYVAKIRHVESEQDKKRNSKNLLGLAVKKELVDQPTPPSFTDNITPSESKPEKPSLTTDTSSDTVYSTDMDSSSNIHISIIIQTPKQPSPKGSTKNLNCTKSDNGYKNIKQENDSCDKAKDKKNEYYSSEKFREMLINSSNTQERCENVTDANRSAFVHEDMFGREEPFRLDNRMKKEDKYNLSSPDNIHNSRRFDSNESVTLKCNKSENIEVIPVTSPPHEVKSKWNTNTPLLPPK